VFLRGMMASQVLAWQARSEEATVAVTLDERTGTLEIRLEPAEGGGYAFTLALVWSGEKGKGPEGERRGQKGVMPMQKRSRIILMILIVLAGTFAGRRMLESAGSQEGEKAAVQAVLEQFWGAFPWDAERLAGALHVPSVLVETDPESAGGAVYLIDEKEIAKLKEERGKSEEEVAKRREEFGNRRTIEKCEIELLGKSAAVARYTLIWQEEHSAGGRQRTQRHGTLLHKGEKRWKIVASTILP